MSPDPARVLVRPFQVGAEERAARICAWLLSLSEERTRDLLEGVMGEFGGRHQKTREFLRRRFQEVQQHLPTGGMLSVERELLVGAYFTQEYSLEAAALFNPSIGPHPDQSAGALRFAMRRAQGGKGGLVGFLSVFMFTPP